MLYSIYLIKFVPNFQRKGQKLSPLNYVKSILGLKARDAQVIPGGA